MHPSPPYTSWKKLRTFFGLGVTAPDTLVCSPLTVPTGWVLFNMAQPLFAQLIKAVEVASEGGDEEAPTKGKKKIIKKKK